MARGLYRMMFLEQLLSNLNGILRFPCYVIARRYCVNILRQTSLLLDLDRNGVSIVFSFSPKVTEPRKPY